LNSFFFPSFPGTGHLLFTVVFDENDQRVLRFSSTEGDYDKLLLDIAEYVVATYGVEIQPMVRLSYTIRPSEPDLKVPFNTYNITKGRELKCALQSFPRHTLLWTVHTAKAGTQREGFEDDGLWIRPMVDLPTTFPSEPNAAASECSKDTSSTKLEKKSIEGIDKTAPLPQVPLNTIQRRSSSRASTRLTAEKVVSIASKEVPLRHLVFFLVFVCLMVGLVVFCSIHPSTPTYYHQNGRFHCAKGDYFCQMRS